MHDRSRMAIDPRPPPIPGRSTSGYDRPGGVGVMLLVIIEGTEL